MDGGRIHASQSDEGGQPQVAWYCVTPLYLNRGQYRGENRKRRV